MLKKILKATCIGIKNSMKEAFEIVGPLLLWGLSSILVMFALAGVFSLIGKCGIWEVMQSSGAFVLICIPSSFLGAFVAAFIIRIKDTVKISEEKGVSMEEAWKESDSSCDECF